MSLFDLKSKLLQGSYIGDSMMFMFYLNSLKGVLSGIIEGSPIGFIKGDTRNFDYSSFGCASFEVS